MSADSLDYQREQPGSAPAPEAQFRKLVEVISRSQHSYRGLIDNLDQAVFTLSLDGEVRVANRCLSEILGVSFQDLIGHPLREFIDSPTLADVERSLPAFLQKGVWSGTIPVRLKKDKELRHFACWFQTVVEEGQATCVTGWARDVTVQHEAEIRFAELFESLREGILFVTPEGKLLDANPALVRTLGYDSKEELQSHNFREMYDDPAVRDALIRELEEKGAVQDREIVLRRKDGKRLHCLTSGFAIRDASGHPVRLQGTIVDITERREIEKRLRQEQEFSRRLVANFPDLIAVLDRNGKFTFISDKVKDVLGRSPEEYIGGQFGARANPEDRARLQGMLKSILSGEVSRAQVEFSAPHTNGTWRVLLATASPLFDEAGKITGMVTSTRDITETRKIEQLLHKEQEFVRRLIECFPDLIAVLDRDLCFTYVTERVKDVLGLSSQDFLGQRMGRRTHPEDQPRLQEALQSIMSGRKAYVETEYRVRHADGSWRTLRGSVGPLFDEAGKISGIVQTARDVTESKRLEEHLAQKEKFAAMGQMMAGAAHELNNPLTAILGVSDLLRERAADEATRRHVDLILQQARRAAAIVQDLLAFSRPPTQERSNLRLEELVREALQLQRAALGQKNIRAQFTAPGDLPAVEGDRKLLMQVFSNIIENAGQAMSAARDHGTLDISLARVGDRIRITFVDDGPGISPENLKKIFDPFFTTKRPGGGSGLGLTICLAVIKEHGGTIEVQSTPGAGATFHVLLPVASGDVPAEPRLALAAASAPSGSETLRGRTVLIVDDEESIREIIQEGLSARGMKVHAVGSSEAALSYLATNTSDVILCDFNLPGLNGNQLFEKVRAQQCISCPVFVFMTGDLVDPAASAQCADKGASILQKPFHISALAALLAERLRLQPAKAG